MVVVDWEMLGLLQEEFAAKGLLHELVWELLVSTGGRRAEVAGLRRRDADLARREVWISQPLNEVDGKLVRARKPKGGRRRAVSVGPELAKKLERWLKELPDDPDTPLLPAPRDWTDVAAGRQRQALAMRDQGASLREIAESLGYAHESSAFKALKAAVRTRRSRGGPLVWNNYQRRHWQPAVDRAARRRAVVMYKELRAQGTERTVAVKAARAEQARLRGLTPHHLRHLAAAIMWASGATDHEVQQVLGHADVATSRKLYAHLLPGAGESVVARAERFRLRHRGGGIAQGCRSS